MTFNVCIPCFCLFALNSSDIVNIPFAYVTFSPPRVAAINVESEYSPRSKSYSVASARTISLSPSKVTGSATSSTVVVISKTTVRPCSFLAVTPNFLTPIWKAVNASALIVSVPFSKEYAVNSSSSKTIEVISVKSGNAITAACPTVIFSAATASL